ncbi:MAG: DUF4783 domain-containing protein [Bacteroidales bacterium]|nr:DUF4783 domain-containing protein [Bacteroidales bacterium]MCF8402900.1 DUF4783 domain-containing protein [Bacteroidales bacterium]
MKFHILILSFSFIFLAGFKSNGQDDITSRINKALEIADASKLASSFSSTIDLEIPGTDGNFSKNQAEIIVKDFFKKNPVKSYKSNHLGSSNDGSKYIIGTYSSSNNKTFRVYILLKKRDENILINQLQFEQE